MNTTDARPVQLCRNQKPRSLARLGWQQLQGFGLVIVLSLSVGLRVAPAQTATSVEDAAVRVSAVVRPTPAQVKLVWSSINGRSDAYTIWRKAPGAGSWGSPLASLASSTATEYDDNAVVAGTAYEYRIQRTATGGLGYVCAGIGVPAIESRGTLVLIVVNTHATFLAAELERLRSDLVGDGWQVVRHDVAPTATPPQVKALIRADYLADPTQVKAVLLLGHVAVPYSGAINLDGHPEHVGAWPADVYYADMNGTWTDTQVNTTSAQYPENRNVPGDGKFDQSTIPGSVQLQLGRVDLSNLPAFSQTEQQLLQRYLHKDHQFRHREVTVAESGRVDDRLGFYGGEAFANNGWRNFTALFGQGAVSAGPYFTTPANQRYLMAFACGAGGYSNIVGVGHVSQFSTQAVSSVFNLFFGSYFGDWNNPNNFLRGSIAGEGLTLTSCWAGRPNWVMHHMGIGETVGQATQRTQQGSYALYQNFFGARSVSITLMGDPTLRLHPLAPASAPVATVLGQQAALSWTASPEAALGYYVYRASSPAGPFTRLTAQAVTASTFTDPAPLAGTSTYMVRALALKSSGSGSYYNLSQGVFVDFTAPPPPAIAQTWLGAASSNWNLPANWSTGIVPGTVNEVTIPAGTPFAPTIGGDFQVSRLTLAPQAQLTVAAGASLTVQHAPLLQPAGSGLPTAIVLAAGTVATPGGLLKVLDHATPSAGLSLPAGTRLAVGNYAEIQLVGSLSVAGGSASFAALGRLAFTRNPDLPAQALPHSISGTAPVRLGILAVRGAGETLTLQSVVEVLSQVTNQGVIMTNGSLTLLSTLGQQAILAPVVSATSPDLTLGSYLGAVRVQVYVDGSRNAGLGYRHVSAPVGQAHVGQLATTGFAPVVNAAYNTTGNTVRPFPTVLRYNQARVGAAGIPGPVGFDQGWLSPDSLTSTLAPGYSYAVNMRGNATLSFSGPPFTGPLFFINGLAENHSPEAGWYLFGNPYAAPLDWDQIANGGTALIALNPSLYVFKSSGAYAGSYASYLPGVAGSPGLAVNGGSRVIPVGQGFFVRKSSPNYGGLIRFALANLLSAPATTNVQRPTADTRPRLTLALRNAAGTQAHQTIIYFQAGATAGQDVAFDAPYLPGTGPALMLTSTDTTTPYSINGLPGLTGADVLVPLQLRATVAGTYQLAVEELAALPAGYHAYLRDASTGTLTDLARTTTTAVSLPAHAIVSRYAVLFSTQPRVLATAPAALAALVSIYPNPAHGTATLHLPLAMRSAIPTDVMVLNALGQQVAAPAAMPVGAGLEISLAGLAPGLYTVRVATSLGTVSRRLVVE